MKAVKVLIIQNCHPSDFIKAVEGLRTPSSDYEIFAFCQGIQPIVLERASIKPITGLTHSQSFIGRKFKKLGILKMVRKMNFDMAAITSSRGIPSRSNLHYQLFLLFSGVRKRAILYDTGAPEYISFKTFLKDVSLLVGDLGKLVLLEIILLPVFVVTVLSVLFVDLLWSFNKVLGRNKQQAK